LTFDALLLLRHVGFKWIQSIILFYGGAEASKFA